MLHWSRWTLGLFFWELSVAALAQAPVPPARPLPVREVTVFKDGHAFVLHAGTLPTDAQGHVPMDTLPTPVIGTFWPYAKEPRAQLQGVTASAQRVRVTRSARNVRELIAANPGAKIILTLPNDKRLDAEIVETLARPTEPSTPGRASGFPTTSAFGSGGFSVPEVALLKTKEGTQALPLDQIQTVTFRGAYTRQITEEISRNRMTLQLNWQGGARGRTAQVGMVYLQRGLRWVPSYRLQLDGKGQARVKLQATLINEMVDLEDVTAHLVIGVPSFAFKDTPDAISLQQSFPELSRYFQSDAQTGYAFSNGIMSQTMAAGRMGERMGNFRGAAPGGPENVPGEVGADRNEDLFLFTVKHITLKRGQSMALPIAEFRLPYRDVFTLDISPQRLPQLANLSSEQQREMARMLRAPRVLHRIRLTNKSPYPLTTAPVLIANGERIIAQAMMTYTAVGGEADVTLTTAGEIRANKTEQEKQRTPAAMRWHDTSFDLVEMTGTLALSNFGKAPVELEITRTVQGHLEKTEGDSTASMISLEDAPLELFEDQRYYLHTGVNGVGRLFWKRTLQPGENLELSYAWRYFTR